MTRFLGVAAIMTLGKRSRPLPSDCFSILVSFIEKASSIWLMSSEPSDTAVAIEAVVIKCSWSLSARLSHGENIWTIWMVSNSRKDLVERLEQKIAEGPNDSVN